MALIIGTLASGGLAPLAPTIGTATDGGTGTTVSVAFTAPSWVGKGSGTVTYTATSSPGNITGTATSSPITVSGLTTGTAYTFTVTATTSYGITGPASAASNSVTPVSPSSFDSIASATPSGQTTVTFSSLPTSTYSWLEIRYVMGFGDGLTLRFNNTSTSDYFIIGNYVNGTSQNNGQYQQRANGQVDWGNAGGAGSYPYVGIIRIGDYRSGASYKSYISSSSEMQSTSTTNGIAESLSGGYLQSYSAITSIQLIWTNNASNPIFSLYGVKGTIS